MFVVNEGNGYTREVWKDIIEVRNESDAMKLYDVQAWIIRAPNMGGGEYHDMGEREREISIDDLKPEYQQLALEIFGTLADGDTAELYDLDNGSA